MDLNSYRFSKEHEWVRLDGLVAVIGITEHAAGELGDIVFVELPKVGAEYTKDAELGTIESVKTVSSIYSPITGSVVETNDSLSSEPNLVNDSAYEKGWLAKMALSDPSEVDSLMSYPEYLTFVG